ncbi:hypothetical protein L484_026477 [Morus notabilis]|uniref:Uncharacterized protein n=1 Tax=Morus notabilis TaxID=981085 RepID=W9QYZ4_9ROSA|nr:hypothetical protein L484_026477 [Morus notabilis]
MRAHAFMDGQVGPRLALWPFHFFTSPTISLDWVPTFYANGFHCQWIEEILVRSRVLNNNINNSSRSSLYNSTSEKYRRRNILSDKRIFWVV